MNDILKDLINMGEVAVFMDEVLIGTKEEKGHDKIVKEVLKRIKENDLYVKPEKCVWKVREINFLGLVMGLGGIKMQKNKVAKVLEWPIPKTIKDIQKFLGLANYYRRFVKKLCQDS